MTRKALLIEASNVKNQTDLPGARLDIENWTTFLKTDLGGAWLESEIVTLHKPLASSVENELKLSKDCYCFVAFSGHGCNGSVVLNDYDSFPAASLKPKTDRGTLILDTCRGVSDPVALLANLKVAMANECIAKAVILEAMQGRATVLASQADPVVIFNRMLKGTGPRPYWDKAVQDASAGVVQMLACSKGEAAGETPSAGGYYTSLLLQSAQIWDTRSTAPATHSTKDAHDYAARKLPSQQTPEYSPSWLAFPFAVKV